MKRQGDVCEFPLAQTRYQLPGQTEIQSETPIKDKETNQYKTARKLKFQLQVKQGKGNGGLRKPKGSV